MAEKEGKSRSKKAEVGDTIQITKGLENGKKGKVVLVRENSVIVELGINKKTNEPIKTVVNHKHYKVLKK